MMQSQFRCICVFSENGASNATILFVHHLLVGLLHIKEIYKVGKEIENLFIRQEKWKKEKAVEVEILRLTGRQV